MTVPISALLRHAEHNHSDREVVSRAVEGDLHRCSRAALTARARRVANALAAAGVVPGDRVATLAWNGNRHVELAFAACGSGAILHALDPRLHPDSIVRIADDARVRIVFFDLSFMPLVEEIAPRLAAATTFIALTERANMPVPGTIWDLLCYENFIAGAPDDFDWPDFDDKTIASMRRMAGRATEMDSAVSTLLPVVGAFAPDDLTPPPQDVVLAAVPMFDVDGWRLTSEAWAAGAALVFPGPWLDGRSLHDLIEDEGVTIVAARPQVWQGLLAHVEREGCGLAGLRRAIVAGDCPPATADTLRDRYGVTVLHAPTASPLNGRGGALAGSAGVTETASDILEESP
jgi:3-(methylthio)propionyl---CoA ligase